MKLRLISLLLVCVHFSAISQDVNSTWSVRFSNAMTYRYTPTINALTAKGWEYSNTIITHGMEKVYNNVTDSVKYLNYIQAYIDTYVNGSGVISASVTVNSLDRTHPGISCLFLYEKTGLLKYKTAATTLRNMYVGGSATYPKTATGNIFWHKNNGSYNNIILIDGIYMLHPFLAKYGSMFNDPASIDTAVNQTLYIYNQLYDASKHLIRHAWNPTKTETWADPVTGNSPEVWSRGMGWFCMALVDILKYVPASHPRRAELISALSNLATGIQTYQDATTGLWYQVVDKGTTLAGNYLETSGSAMFIYTLKVAADSGWISTSYKTVAQKGWDYLKNTTNLKIDIYSDGYPRINDFAPAMSVQTSAANYVQVSLQPVDCPGTTHPHGYGAILMTASVMEFPINLILPVQFTAFSGQITSTGNKLNWENTDDVPGTVYEIERSVNNQDFSKAGSLLTDQSGKYTWTDPITSMTNTYYRIHAVSPSGKSVYSKILVLRPEMKTGISIWPNPVTDNQLNVSVSNPVPGTYTFYLHNSAGFRLLTKKIQIDQQGSCTVQITLPSIPGGMYFLTMQGEENKITRSIIIR